MRHRVRPKIVGIYRSKKYGSITVLYTTSRTRSFYYESIIINTKRIMYWLVDEKDKERELDVKTHQILYYDKNNDPWLL